MKRLLCFVGLHWLFADLHVRGANLYHACRWCGARKVTPASPFLVGPVDEEWLRTGKHDERKPLPPRGGSGVVRPGTARSTLFGCIYRLPGSGRGPGDY